MIPTTIDTVMVLAGGLGTRLRPVVSDRPKPMAEVGGRPFLAYLLDFWTKNGARKIVLSVGYMGDAIEQQIGPRWGGVCVEYARESTPLGTGGAIRNALKLVDNLYSPIVIVNGDTWLDIDVARFVTDFHIKRRPICMALAHVKNNIRYHRVDTSLEGRVLGLSPPDGSPALINGGAYVANGSFLLNSLSPFQEPFSFENEFLNSKPGVDDLSCSHQGPRFLDIGVPEDYRKAGELLGG